MVGALTPRDGQAAIVTELEQPSQHRMRTAQRADEMTPGEQEGRKSIATSKIFFPRQNSRNLEI
jgi:hypothetical protein